MAKGITLTSERVMNGSFGELENADGVFLGNVQGITFRIINERRALRPIGSRRRAYKLISTQGEGTIDQLKVTSNSLADIAAMMWNESIVMPQTNLVVHLDDPEAIDYETTILVGVKLWEISGGWRVNELVTEDIPFTFHSILMPHQIPLSPSNMFERNIGQIWGQQNNL